MTVISADMTFFYFLAFAAAFAVPILLLGVWWGPLVSARADCGGRLEVALRRSGGERSLYGGLADLWGEELWGEIRKWKLWWKIEGLCTFEGECEGGLRRPPSGRFTATWRPGGEREAVFMERNCWGKLEGGNYGGRLRGYALSRASTRAEAAFRSFYGDLADGVMRNYSPLHDWQGVSITIDQKYKRFLWKTGTI